jgi:uncharacterized protein YecE (DUF72 family)
VTELSLAVHRPSTPKKTSGQEISAHWNISLCISDHHDAPAPRKRTADFVYIRGHGPGGRYQGHCSKNALAAWAKRVRAWIVQGYNVFVFFDNDQTSAAPIDALKLKQMLPGP